MDVLQTNVVLQMSITVILKQCQTFMFEMLSWLGTVLQVENLGKAIWNLVHLSKAPWLLLSLGSSTFHFVGLWVHSMIPKIFKMMSSVLSSMYFGVDQDISFWVMLKGNILRFSGSPVNSYHPYFSDPILESQFRLVHYFKIPWHRLKIHSSYQTEAVLLFRSECSLK